MDHSKNHKNDLIFAINPVLSVCVNANGSVQRQNIGIDPKARNLAPANWRDQRFVTEFLPRMHVGKMYLNSRNSDRSNGIPESDACVRICRCIENDNVTVPLGLLNPSHQ